jgi:AcrR family transcriptional regulator
MKVTREAFADAMLELLANGRDPDTMTVDELCARLGGASRGSFYNYFRDGAMRGLQEATLAAWLGRRLASVPGSEIGAVRDPAERLRLLHASAAENGRQDVAMRRWAVSDPKAAAAVAEVDEKTGAYLTQALTDMGFGPEESLAMASLLAAALSAAGRQGWLPSLARPATWEAVLSVLTRAAAAASGRRIPPVPDDVQVTPGDAPGELMLHLARSLPAPARRQLADLARELDQEDGPDGHGSEAAGGAAGA